MLSRRSLVFLQSRFLATKYRHTRNSFYYEVLEIPSSASQTQIKEAYFKLSKIHHPDVSNSEDSKMQFQLISDAYTILGNIHSRRMYDRGLISGAVSAQSAKQEEEEFNPFKLPPKPVKTDLDKEVMQKYRDISEQRRLENLLKEEARDKIENQESPRYGDFLIRKAEEQKSQFETGLTLVVFTISAFIIHYIGQHGFFFVEKNKNEEEDFNFKTQF